ncbi:hypothetical protein AB0F74_36845, partial [Nocardia salmonicida]
MSRRGWTLFLAMCVIWGLPYLFMNVRSLPAGVAVIARKFRATIQAVIFAGVPIGARFRFDSACKHCTRRRVPDRFEIRHPIS